MTHNKEVIRIVQAVRYEKIRTKNDLVVCGCNNCLQALKIIKILDV